MGKRLSVNICVAAALWICAQAQALQQYRVIDLGSLDPVRDTFAWPTALNNQGTVVGWGYDTDNVITAFIYRNGEISPLRDASGLGASVATDINDRGQVVGVSFDTRPFLYEQGRFTLLDGPSGSGQPGGARSISNSGRFIAGALGERAFRYADGKLDFIPIEGALTSTVSGVNDDGIVAGFATFDSPGGQFDRAYIFDGKTLQYVTAPDGRNNFIISGINNAGQVIGSGPGGGYIYDHGTYTLLPTLAGLQGSVAAINDKGWVVGGQVPARDAPETHAVLYRDGELFDLNDFVRPAGDKSWVFRQAFDINDRGWIAGEGADHPLGSPHALLAVPVPETAGWALMVLGVAGVMARRRFAHS